jgi:hypothetical protein
VQLGQQIANGALSDKWLIVGDDAFVCKGNVITPYVRKALSQAQRNYNYFLSLNRQVVERSFALWKWKWGLFWRPLLINDQNIKVVIETTCRLHNLCIDVKVHWKTTFTMMTFTGSVYLHQMYLAVAEDCLKKALLNLNQRMQMRRRSLPSPAYMPTRRQELCVSEFCSMFMIRVTKCLMLVFSWILHERSDSAVCGLVP